jgi:hypothetical protein
MSRPIALLASLILVASLPLAAQAAGPEIRIVRPLDLDRYQTEISVEGTLDDGHRGQLQTAGIRRAWWEVLGTALGGEVPYDDEGRFAFTFGAPAERIGVFLKIWAETTDGSLASASVALLRERPVVQMGLSLDQPSDGQYYREHTPLSGRVSGSPDEVVLLTWSLEPPGAMGVLDIAPDGTWAVELDTRPLRGPVTLWVTASTRGGQVLERDSHLLDGVTAPTLAIDSPREGDFHGGLVRLSGVVGPEGGAARLWWQVRDTKLEGEAAVDAQGRFSASIPTAGLTGNAILEVTARCENGRDATTSVTLREEPRDVLFELESPRDRSSYGEEIVIRGRAGSPRPGAWSTAWVESLDFEIVGARTIADRITLDPGTGRFERRIHAGDLDGAVRLRLKLRDRQGKTAERVLTLTQQLLEPPVELVVEPSARPSAEPSVAPPVATVEQPETETAAIAAATHVSEPTVKPLATPAAAASPEETPVPALTLYAPRAEAVYKRSLRIEGLLADGLDQLSAASRFRSVEWALLGTDRRGTIRPNTNGTFSADADTEGIRGSHLLLVTATHRDGERPAQTAMVADDGVGPWLEVQSPAPGDAYGENLTLAGLARDVAGDPRSAAEVATVSYAVAGSADLRGEAEIDPATGAFRAEIAMGRLRGRQTILATARDRNGYETSRSVAVEDGLSIPTITLTAPADGAAYGAYLLVRGKVGVGGEAGGAMIRELRVGVAPSGYELGSAAFAGTATVGADGSFELAVPARGFHGPQKVTVLAQARNGNTAETAATVAEGASETPGFAVTGSDGTVRLSWPEVPLAARYDVTVTGGGTTTTTRDVSSPVEIGGLANGALYAARLRAVLSTGEELESQEEKAIPLAPETLALQARGEYRRIRIWWQQVSGAEAYEVWRSEGAADLARVAATSEQSYLDGDVEYGREYHYRVKPSRYASVSSDPVSAQTTAFPAERFSTESALPASKAILALAVDRSYAYLACGSAGLSVAEIRDPAHPAIVATVDLPDARDVAFATLGDGRRYALVADGERGLVVVDVSLPSEPVVAGNRTTTDARAVAAYADQRAHLAYVADGDAGLKVVDLSVPKRPERIASLQAGNVAALCLRMPYLYAAGRSSLFVFDLTNPAAPVEVSSAPLEDGRGLDADVRGGAVHLYVACGAGGLRIFDLTDPRHPRAAGTFDTPFANATAVATQVYVADGRRGVMVIDVTDPAAPTPLDDVAAGDVRDIAMQQTAGGEQFAYVACSDGLRVVQALVEGRSLELGSFPTGSRGYGIELSGLGTERVTAFVADHARGVHVFGLAGLESPDLSGSGFTIPTTYACETCVVRVGERWCLLVADSGGGLRIHDVSAAVQDASGGQTRLLGTAYATDARAVASFARGQAVYALVADARDGVRVYDIGRPEAPRQIALAPVPGAADVAVAQPAAGSAVALVASPDGLTVVDLDAPEAPAVRGRVPGRSLKVAVLDPVRPLFVATIGESIVVVDCAIRDAPVISSTYASGFVEDISVPEPGSLPRRVYVAEGYRGVSVLEATGPADLRRVSACPAVYAVGIAGRDGSDGRAFAYAVDTTRLWQIEILVPRWIAERGAAGAP